MCSQLVIFDCDGVLIDSEIISARMLQAEAARWDVDMSIEHILQNYVGRSYPTVLAEIQSKFKVTLPSDFEENYRARLLAAFERELRIMPGVRSVLENLGIAFCVATSSSPARVSRSLQLVGLGNLTRGKVFTVSEVNNGKPAPDLFYYAAKKMAVPAEKSMVIEDSFSGVDAGLAAGMHTVRFSGGSHVIDKSEAHNAQFVFDKFKNFFDYYPELRRAE